MIKTLSAAHFSCSETMKERVVIIFIAVTLGLIATTIGFFLYESSKPTHEVTFTKTTKEKSTTAAKADVTLTILSPKDTSVTANRTIAVQGKTDPGNIVIVSTNQQDVAVSPTTDGNFTASTTIDAGENIVRVEAINPDGKSKVVSETVSYSSDQF